jgi:hypothetical protein
VAHATVLGATIRKLTVLPVQLALGSRNLSPSQKDNASNNTNIKVAFRKPSGQQYQFYEQEFVDFNDNQLLRNSMDISMAVKNPVAQTSSNESDRSSVVITEEKFYPADAMPPLLPRHARIISEDLRNQLLALLVAP